MNTTRPASGIEVARPLITRTVVPDPDRVSEDVMALHHVLEALIAAEFSPQGLEGLNCRLAANVLPILRHVSEQARRAAMNIDHLARGV